MDSSTYLQIPSRCASAEKTNWLSCWSVFITKEDTSHAWIILVGWSKIQRRDEV